MNNARSSRRGVEKPRRERWTVEEAKTVLVEWRESGEALSQFALERGLQLQRLQRWLRRLDDGAVPPRKGREVRPNATPALAPVMVVGPRSALSAAVTVRVRTGDAVEIAAPEAVTPSWLGALVRALEDARR